MDPERVEEASGKRALTAAGAPPPSAPSPSSARLAEEAPASSCSSAMACSTMRRLSSLMYTVCRKDERALCVRW